MIARWSGDVGVPSSYFLGKTKALEAFPMLKDKGLVGAMVYYDGEFEGIGICGWSDVVNGAGVRYLASPFSFSFHCSSYTYLTRCTQMNRSAQRFPDECSFGANGHS